MPNMKKFEVSAFGETMLRYSVPSGERLSRMDRLDVHIGGAETNTLGALSGLGRRCGWSSGVPNNDLGRLVLHELAGAGVDTSAVVIAGERVGSYYVEFAAAPRPINVIYDRAHSAVSQLTPAEIDWATVLDSDVIHLTGITPALSQGCHDIVVEALQRAKSGAAAVSFDVNYRSKLWSPAEARRHLTPLINEVDILICGEGDAEIVFGLSGTAEEVLDALYDLSGARHIILTQSSRGSTTRIDDQLHQVDARPADIVDRLGAGDAYAAGVIDGFLDGDIVAGMKRGSILSALALTQHGDMITTTRQELQSLLASDESTIKR